MLTNTEYFEPFINLESSIGIPISVESKFAISFFHLFFFPTKMTIEYISVRGDHRAGEKKQHHPRKARRSLSTGHVSFE